MKRCSGIYIYFKVENARGKRIQDFFVAGKRLDKKKNYRVCFLTTQGVPAKYGSNRENLDMKATTVLADYIERNSPVSPIYEQAIVPI